MSYHTIRTNSHDNRRLQSPQQNNRRRRSGHGGVSPRNSYYRSPRGRSRTPHCPHGSYNHYGPQGQHPVIPPGSVTGSSPHFHHGPPIQGVEHPVIPPGSVTGSSPHFHHGPPVQGEDWRDYLTPAGESAVNAYEKILEGDRKRSKKRDDMSKDKIIDLANRAFTVIETIAKGSNDVCKHALTTMKENTQSSMKEMKENTQSSMKEMETITKGSNDVSKHALTTMKETAVEINSQSQNVGTSMEKRGQKRKVSGDEVETETASNADSTKISDVLTLWEPLSIIDLLRMESSSKSLLDKTTELENTVAGLRKELKRKTDKIEQLLEFRVEDQQNQRELVKKVMILQEKNNEYLSEIAKLKAENNE